MNSLIRLVANYALVVVAVGALASWLRTPRPSKLPYAAAAVLGVLLVAVAIKGLAATWVDPRPFVVDHTTPLIPHGADNGFPSDHTALATVVAAVVLAWHRRLGAALLVVAVVLGAARVAAHVHHVPDILGGLGAGLLAAAVATLVVRHIPWSSLSWTRSLTQSPGARDQPVG